MPWVAQRWGLTKRGPILSILQRSNVSPFLLSFVCEARGAALRKLGGVQVHPGPVENSLLVANPVQWLPCRVQTIDGIATVYGW